MEFILANLFIIVRFGQQSNLDNLVPCRPAFCLLLHWLRHSAGLINVLIGKQRCCIRQGSLLYIPCVLIEGHANPHKGWSVLPQGLIAVVAGAAALGHLHHQYSLILSRRLAPFHQGPFAPWLHSSPGSLDVVLSFSLMVEGGKVGGRGPQGTKDFSLGGGWCPERVVAPFSSYSPHHSWLCLALCREVTFAASETCLSCPPSCDGFPPLPWQVPSSSPQRLKALSTPGNQGRLCHEHFYSFSRQQFP